MLPLPFCGLLGAGTVMSRLGATSRGLVKPGLATVRSLGGFDGVYVGRSFTGLLDGRMSVEFLGFTVDGLSMLAACG